MRNAHGVSKIVAARRCDRGAALVVGVIALFVVAGLSAAYVSVTANSLVRISQQERNYVASNLAEAGIEHIVIQEGNSLTGPDFVDRSYDLDSLADGLVTGATGSATVTPLAADRSYAKVRATATYRNASQTIEVLERARPVGPWETAIFAGSGQAGGVISGNVKVAGSIIALGEGEPFTDANANGVRDGGESYQDIDGDGSYDQPLTSSDTALSFSGTSIVQNNYAGMPAALSSRVPALQTTPYGGETVASLDTDVRVKRGQVSLSGTGEIGDSNNSGDGDKETVDGVYVTHGWAGNKGATNVHSDNGTSTPYDLGNKLKFPHLSSPYTDPATGTNYASYSAYLDANSLLLPDNIDGTADGKIVISDEVSSFTSSNAKGSISWDKATGTLTISGIVKAPITLDLGVKDKPVDYVGKGTLYSTGDVRIHSDILSKSTFPTTDCLGVMAGNSMYLATGGGESQVNMTGAFFAQNKIVSTRQNQIAGAFVSNYFDMGSNVPSIYHVPSIAQNLPPGLPKGGGAIYVMHTVSWRRVKPGT